MTKLIEIILIILLASCVRVKPNQVYTLPKNEEINEIIETIVLNDSLPVLVNTRPPDTVFTKGLPNYIINHRNIPICVELRKLEIKVPKLSTDGYSEMYGHNSILINSLLNTNINRKTFFNESDSLYFLFQNDTLKQFRFQEKFASRLTQTTFIEQSNKLKANEYVSYYDLTVPVFSLDNKKAYVEVTFNCTGLCGSSRAIYLEKINGTWIIIGKKLLWIS